VLVLVGVARCLNWLVPRTGILHAALAGGPIALYREAGCDDRMSTANETIARLPTFTLRFEVLYEAWRHAQGEVDGFR
jgi:hypothetical protein